MYAPAAANCREALARRQVMIEKGILPANFPIPAHLRNGVPDDARAMPLAAQKPADFIPLTDVRLSPALGVLAA